MSYMDISGLGPDGFEVGNVYTKSKASSMPLYSSKEPAKVFYIAISKKTLVTYVNGRFGKKTTKKEGHTSIGISVADLCDKWQVKLDEFDDYMHTHFQPDEEARLRARKEKYDQL